MLEIIKPGLYVSSLARVPVGVLVDRGIKGLVVDLDNTVTLWNDDYLAPEVLEWFSTVSRAGLKACLTSNNSPERGRRVVERLALPAVFNCGKPRRRGLRQALEVLGMTPRETALIGDQIFTDVLGGNRLGLYTILVRPISPYEFIGTRFMRRLERVVLRSLPGPE
ncbi:MAG: YqeG family HAD IIIA-type phosphatase [Clostridia bacterium]|nr:MAG: YqeG family HAD IIIA-type phosphatase [Clostridia bacterium]